MAASGCFKSLSPTAKAMSGHPPGAPQPQHQQRPRPEDRVPRPSVDSGAQYGPGQAGPSGKPPDIQERQTHDTEITHSHNHQQAPCEPQRNCDAQMHPGQSEAQQAALNKPPPHSNDNDYQGSRSVWGLFRASAVALNRTPDYRRDVLCRPGLADDGNPGGGQMPEEVSQDSQVLRDARALSPRKGEPLSLQWRTDESCVGNPEASPLVGLPSEQPGDALVEMLR